jgi:hypothetical protein
MSFDTLFEVSPNCLLAFPTVFVSDLTSTTGRLGRASRRGTETPRTFRRLGRLFSASPPATPTAAAPTAIAGRPAFPATFLIRPTTPLALCAERLRFELPPLELDFPRLWPLRELPLELARDPLLERELLPLLRLRDEAGRFERDAADDRVEPLAFDFEVEGFAAFDERSLLFLVPEAALLSAIAMSPVRGLPARLPRSIVRLTRNLRRCAALPRPPVLHGSGRDVYGVVLTPGCERADAVSTNVFGRPALQRLSRPHDPPS